ncbi:MAG TPA: GNAT family N-acetyltransferase [Longimicrobiales bacterium]|nr:GNAT family N-acetyltransferase [Longimicrobiales bacterium]
MNPTEPAKNISSAILIDMREATAAQQEQAARVLISALAHVPAAWKDFASASAEVATFIDDPERVAMLAVHGESVRGWIGAIKHSEFGWELHPLAVDPLHQRQGIGTQLVTALETKARSEGVLTVWLGTDDDFGGTNLYGQDLYPDVLGTLQKLRVTSGHPYRFYEKLGYTVTGVFPDVDGIGKHDILMARRITE